MKLSKGHLSLTRLKACEWDRIVSVATNASGMWWRQPEHSWKGGDAPLPLVVSDLAGNLKHRPLLSESWLPAFLSAIKAVFHIKVLTYNDGGWSVSVNIELSSSGLCPGFSGVINTRVSVLTDKFACTLNKAQVENEVCSGKKVNS